ncbi:MAG: hypothetical protein IIB55_08345, partial [Planctomycetes bacterium]|nr:hypothetical protein [Planctomycetota bacterium]
MGGKRLRVSTSDDSRQSRAVPSPIPGKRGQSRAVPSPVSRTSTRATSPDHRSNWLCIAYAFPPINRSGAHRTLGFGTHLDVLGFDATVLTVTPKGEPIDRTRLDRVPATTRVLRTPWWDIIPAIKRAWRPEFLWRSRSSFKKNTRRNATTPRRKSLETSGVFEIEPHRRSLEDWLTRLLITPDSRIGWLMPGVARGLREIKRRRPRVIYSTSPCMTAHLIALV